MFIVIEYIRNEFGLSTHELRLFSLFRNFGAGERRKFAKVKYV